ncbi:MAG: WbqC family protein [Nitrospirae bacterium]|nr:WbqC family protein [Nitrospirota bacterium]
MANLPTLLREEPKMILSVHQPQYISWLGYFDKIYKSDCFVFLDSVQYKSREYQNRNKIRTKDGWIWLTVPVISKGMHQQKICDVRINNDSDWQRQHRESLRVWYGRAKFFKNYFPFFEKIYTKKWEKLIDLNVCIINYILKALKINTPIYYESELGITTQGTGRIIEICKKIGADVYLSGIGGKDYLEEEKFSQAGIKLEYQNFIHPTYHQQYMGSGNIFLPYMSCIDLLFNEGEGSGKILRSEDRNKLCGGLIE